MKTFLILLLSLSSLAFAEVDCDNENNLEKLAKGITYPNCGTPENVEGFQSRNQNSLCGKCKSDFEIVHGKKITSNKDHIQEEFFNSAFNEYKKNLTNNLLNSAKLRSIYKTKSKFSKSVTACKMKTPADFANGCKSESAKKLLLKTSFFSDLSKELSNDLAIFLSTDPSFKPTPTLLNRSQQSCNIPEKDIMLFTAATYEEALSPDMIEFFKKIDPKNVNSINDLFNDDIFFETFGDQSELKESLKTHPLFSSHLKDGKSFIDFIKKVPSPASTEKLRATLYSKENGDSFDKTLAEDCNNTFKALQDSICSTEFENGNLYVDPVSNFKKLNTTMDLPVEENFASSEELIDNNIKLLELCENKDSKEKLSLTKTNEVIGSSLIANHKSLSMKEYRGSKYDSEIGYITNSLCEMTDTKCIKGTLECSIYEKYKAFNTPVSKANRPADFANAEANELLRSMIGDTTKLDIKTKQILIAEGIIPREDGKLNEKPEIPESQEEFFAKLPSQQITHGGPGKTKPNSTSNMASSQQARTQPSTDNYAANSLANNNSSTAPAGDMNDISDLVRGSTEDLKDIQDEIKRRLGALPQNKPATLNDAKKIARDTFKNKGRKITPYQEQALAERMLQPEVPNSVSPVAIDNSPSRTAVSDTDTQLEKWKKGQKDAALMGMQGAQKVLAANDAGRAPASVEAKPKDLTKVALNIAEDPRVKLSDIFASKIDQNDPETQLLKVLLKNKNNFLLQVKDMNFKIIFDNKNNFNVLFESGDRAEAERMRPQLEIFLKRLKS